MKEFKVEKPSHISDFAREFDFEDLRPYYESEVGEVMKRMSEDPTYFKLMKYLWPEVSEEQARKKAADTKSIRDFQTGYMAGAIWHIVNNSSDGLTYSGLDKLDKNKSYLFIANHRDILLDSAITQIVFDKEGFATSEITFGSNLMEKGFITDFGKMNRMFAVKREGNSKELYYISRELSAYIRHTLIDKNSSVWIAQRNGRTKDGNDQTQTGLLKMLALSGNGDFLKTFGDLNIVPLTISYEYEPCDALKVQELYLSSLHSKYVKAPGEDLNSIITGIKQPKGKSHLSFGTVIKDELPEINKTGNDNEKIKQLVAVIDKQIYQHFKLYPVSYIAYDLAFNTNVFENNYNAELKHNFIEYVAQKVASLNGEADVLKTMFYKMYAFPVINKLEK